MNSIQPNMGFRARVKLKDVNELAAAVGPVASSGSSALGSTASGIVGTTASHAAGSALNTVGSAFSAHASGVNSSGIVPSVIESATPYVTPATIASSKANPSTMGTIFSTIGDFFHSLGKVKIRIKDPN